jgi:hypothetical protein
MDNQPILKKTLVTVGVMVGAWVAFVGTLAVVIVVATSHLSGQKEEVAEEAPTTATPHVGSRVLRDRPPPTLTPPAAPTINPRHQ